MAAAGEGLHLKVSRQIRIGAEDVRYIIPLRVHLRSEFQPVQDNHWVSMYYCTYP